MYKDKKLSEASLTEILEEIHARAFDYNACFIGEAMTRNKVSDRHQRRMIINADLQTEDKASPSVLMLDWIIQGKDAQTRAENFVKNILEREKDK